MLQAEISVNVGLISSEGSKESRVGARKRGAPV